MSVSKQVGFSLVEVLISVLILSIGVLGAAAMQLSALRTMQQSAFHTIAFQLATEMAEIIRASKYQMNVDDEFNPFLLVNYKSTITTAVPSTSCFSRYINCLPNDLAKFDIYEWEQKIKLLLPNGRAVICRDAHPWDTATSEFKWECTGPQTAYAPLVIKLGWQGKNPDGTLTRDVTGQFPPTVALVVDI